MSSDYVDVEAIATTAVAKPGTETPSDDGTVSVAGQAFEDIIESDDPRLAGRNHLVVDLHMNPADGSGTLEGTFKLVPDGVDGEWLGRLSGKMVNGMITSTGLAVGTGSLDRGALRIDFRQLPEHPGSAPIENPLAFFEMTGCLLAP